MAQIVGNANVSAHARRMHTVQFHACTSAVTMVPPPIHSPLASTYSCHHQFCLSPGFTGGLDLGDAAYDAGEYIRIASLAMCTPTRAPTAPILSAIAHPLTHRHAMHAPTDGLVSGFLGGLHISLDVYTACRCIYFNMQSFGSLRDSRFPTVSHVHGHVQ